jgi:hypothetical protein
VAEVGVWIDIARDGFGTGGGAGDEPGLLARIFPEGGSSTSDNLTTYVIRYEINRGFAQEVIGGSPTDTATITVNNSSGYFSPDNTASPWYGLLGPGCPVWIGINDDGSITTPATVIGRFAGVIREIVPIPVAGADNTPTAELICDGILADYDRTPVTLADSTTRSQGSFRAAILAAIGETRTSLASEPDPLPLSSADSTSALSVLEELNRANGTRHFIAPADNVTAWYSYTTRNRHYKLGTTADASIDAASQHLTAIDGWRYNNDGVINSQRATIDPVRFTPATATVWSYEAVPFTVSGNKVIWANFDDYVQDPVLSVNGAGITSTLTAFGRSAKIELSAAGATVTELSIEGSQVIRDSTITLTGDYVAEAAPSQAKYRVRSGSDLAGDLLGAEATAQGIIDHIIWRYAPRPLKRPRVTIVNWFPTMLTLNPYDILGTTVAAVSASGMKFDVVGITDRCEIAANTVKHYQVDFQLAESRLQDALTWFTLNSSTLNSTAPLGY